MNSETAHLLKQKLRKRDRQLVVNIDYTNASLVAYLAREFADVIFVDCEQGDASIESIPDLVRASHIEGTPCIVRTPDRNPETIERYLYRGVDGIVVPRVDSAEEALDVMAAVDYCMGDKSDNVSVVIQIESLNAADEIDAFLAIETIDAFFIGPVDLSRSMGFKGDFTARPVRKKIDHLINTIRKANRCVGMLCTHETITQLEIAGCRFLYTHTNDFLQHGKDSFLPPKLDERLVLLT
jgi:2-keto-3-deoxy-L-rhamnonate aldolase RhmA